MLTFADSIQSDIEGLFQFAGWVNRATERRLLTAVDSGSWLQSLKRRVQHFGYQYDYKARTVNSNHFLGRLPDWLDSLGREMVEEQKLPAAPDQVIINEYLAGQGISPHVDCVSCFTESIASLSLGSSCVMQFSHIESEQKVSVFVAPRTLTIMTGEARYRWRHSIPARKKDKIDGDWVSRGRRISLTFRKVITTKSEL